jgi:hypothetical protein
MKLSLKSMVMAGALFTGIGFLFVSVMNVLLRPYGGAYLAILASLYPLFQSFQSLTMFQTFR